MPVAGGSSGQMFKSAQARYAAYAAERCGYAFRSLDGEDGYLFEVRDGARVAAFATGAGTPYALNDARAASIARDKAFCAEVLRGAGVPVVPGKVFFITKRWAEMRSPGREPEDAQAFAEAADYPLFCKPISASSGQFAEVVTGPPHFADYMARVAQDHFAILVQPYFRAAAEYRVFVMNGQALFSYRKTPPCVIGDGESTLRALIERQGASFASMVEQDLDAIVPRGEGRTLAGAANRALGGGSDLFRDGAPAPLAALALAAAKAIDLQLAGVDIFDVRGDQAELMVIEVNSNPMIATLEDRNRWDLIERIWRANFDAALR
ncbi:MAG: hypothetical protein JNJ63_04040 [Hyphomonadaceae bacterium]|nr:hypothetical protein [Hyphomonadaceae bacterium]